MLSEQVTKLKFEGAIGDDGQSKVKENHLQTRWREEIMQLLSQTIQSATDSVFYMCP